MGRPKSKLENRICKNCNNQFEIKPSKKNIFCSTSCAQIFTKSKNKEWLNKRDKTNIDKYGVKSPLESDIVKENYKQSILSKYGVENPFQVKEFKDKANNTILEKYGTKYANQNKEIANKISISLKNRIIDRANFVEIKWEKLKEYENVSGMAPLFNKEDLEEKKLNIEFNNKFKFKCNKCNSITEVYLSNGYLPSCKCSNYKGYSVIEEEISKFLINKIGEEKIELNKRDIIPNRLEIDCYLPSFNLAIEVNGIYWHSESMGKYRDYHLYKTNQCNLKGIDLIHILDYEWLFKKPIIQSILLNRLKFTSNKIYARKCEIKKLEDNKELRIFLDNNHIQGYTHSKINLGLYYNNELVSVMTFSKNRFKKNSNEMEMVRFCNKLNTNIIGGASKLFNHFIKNYNKEKNDIISFADRRFFNGKLYEQLGFKFENNTHPSYLYWKNNIILNRISCQKHKLEKLLDKFDSNKTEYENMKENGWRRVWDCGNIKYKFSFK
jgi:hypothetical protein